METAVSARPESTADGGRSNGVRPSLSSATSFPCCRTVCRRRSPRDFTAPTRAANISWSPERTLAPPATGVSHAGSDVLLLPLGRNGGACSSRAARRVFTAGRSVCVLTDLSSRLEEEYATARKMSSRLNLDFLADSHQDDWPTEHAVREPWRRRPDTDATYRPMKTAALDDVPGPAALVASTAHDAALRRPSPAGTAPRTPRHRRRSRRHRGARGEWFRRIRSGPAG